MARFELQKLYIDGGYVDASGTATFDAINPATGEVLAQVQRATQADVERAVASAVFHDIPAESPDRNTALVDLARERGLSDRAILRGATLYPHTGFVVTSLYGTLHPNRRPQPIIGLTAHCPDSSTDPDRGRA